MKRKMFSIMAIAAVALVSCKKDNVDDTPLGSATINGTVRADIDQTNDVNNAGLYEEGYNLEGVNGMTVKVEVSTWNWDENPVAGYDYDKKTYMTTTDANGDFTLTIPATDNGYNITVVFEDLYGVTKTVYTTDGSTVTQNSYASANNQTAFIYDGAIVEMVVDANIDAVDNDNYEYGTATIQGIFYGNWDDSNDANNFYPGNAEAFVTGSPLAGKTLSWGYINGWEPYGIGSTGVYNFTLDANGAYSIDVPVEALHTMNASAIWFGFPDFIDNQIIMNVAGTADSTAASIYSVGGVAGQSAGNLQDGSVLPIYVSVGITNI